VLAPLGVNNLGPFGDSIVLYGKDKPALLVLTPGNGEAPSSNGVTLGFAAASTADVDAFHAAGLPLAASARAKPVRVAICPVPMPLICATRQATKFAPTPSQTLKIKG
jgi:hypothetical protein